MFRIQHRTAGDVVQGALPNDRRPALETIDAQFLSRLELERKRLTSTPADLEAVAGQLGATLHSISLRARAGWSPDRLRAFAAAAVRQALMVLGDSAA